MVINGINKIKDNDGDYLVLIDYFCEGLSVVQQCATLDDALTQIASGGFSGPMCLVRLVRLDASEVPEVPETP